MNRDIRRLHMQSMSTLLLALMTHAAAASEFHVSVNGNDQNDGSASKPFKTISAAAQAAQPGDVITVHEGTYRERVTPPRGGESDARRIVYQAAAGEKVVIKGSDVVRGWQKVQDDTWKVVIPNSFFGDFNPYKDLIHGDWFNPKGRQHHTGAVYLNGHWLTEAARLEEVLKPIAASSSSYTQGGGGYLLNVAWLRPGTVSGNAGRIPAAGFAAQNGIQTAPCSEGGQCIGWIEDGDWTRYEKVDFGAGAQQIEIRAASQTNGGTIEIRLGTPQGQLLGTCSVPNTGDWQSWSSFRAKIMPVSGLQTLCLVFRGTQAKATVLGNPDLRLWFAQVDETNTTIWAQFAGVNPNETEVEINVRRTVFYPARPGINYLTVRGFTMMHAATPWAPPTAEQIGLIGTHWSKGWIIEDNDIRYSTCVGIALGKYGDQWDNTSQNSAEGYVETINRALKNGWSKENIGHHVVRNNRISDCEQAGVVGSLGAVFSTITGNVIHDIHIRQLFSGAEMAGIKIHAAIDTEISRNHIYRTCLGIWLDWMAQGTHVTRNLLHDNGTDVFVEVDHGPFLVDNNLFLSNTSLSDMSEGAAYVHNLMTGRIVSRPEPNRQTPYHPAHSTAVAGLTTIKGGDDRFYNNILIAPSAEAAAKAASNPRTATGYGLWVYDAREYPLQTGGNVYYNGARPYARETSTGDACVAPTGLDPKPRLVAQGDRVFFHITLGPELKRAATKLVTTELLGKAAVPKLAYENPDGSPVTIDTDYFGAKRDATAPSAGPFENPGQGDLQIKVW
jgi:alpha-N-arabinofuranosidase